MKPTQLKSLSDMQVLTLYVTRSCRQKVVLQTEISFSLTGQYCGLMFQWNISEKQIQAYKWKWPTTVRYAATQTK